MGLKEIALTYDLKTAALYFPYVLPADFYLFLSGGEMAPAEGDDPPPIADLLPSGLSESDFIQHFEIVEMKGKPVVQLIPGSWAYTEEKLRAKGFSLIPVGLTSNSNMLPECPAVALSGLDLVEAHRIRWDKLIELRRDRSSLAKLRNLTHFLLSEYKGKDKHFVVDDLERRIYEYSVVTKQWELETNLGSVELVFSAKWPAEFAAGTAAAILVGGPIPIAAAVGAVAGAIGTLGRLLIHQKRRGMDNEVRQLKSPVSYIIEAREIAENA